MPENQTQSDDPFMQVVPQPVFLDTTKQQSAEQLNPVPLDVSNPVPVVGPVRTFGRIESLRANLQQLAFGVRNHRALLLAAVGIVFAFFTGYKAGSFFLMSKNDSNMLASQFLAAGAQLTVVDDNGKDLKISKAADVSDPSLITGVTIGASADTTILASLPELRGLHTLNIIGISIKKAELLAYLKEAPPTIVSLQLAQLPDVKMDADLLDAIRTDFPSLKALSLKGLQVGKEGFPLLAQIRNLQNLTLAETSVGDEDIVLLKDLKITTLDVAKTKITIQGLLQLRPYIKTLSLAYLPMTDSDIEAVTQYFQNLQKLDISNSSATDRSVASIQSLKELGSLIIKGTQISSAGITSIQQTLPSCKIVVN